MNPKIRFALDHNVNSIYTADARDSYIDQPKFSPDKYSSSPSNFEPKKPTYSENSVDHLLDMFDSPMESNNTSYNNNNYNKSSFGSSASQNIAQTKFGSQSNNIQNTNVFKQTSPSSNSNNSGCSSFSSDGYQSPGKGL